jgi:hypothetical protein
MERMRNNVVGKPVFIDTLRFDIAALCIFLERDSTSFVTVRFDTPRAFRVFSESDEFVYLANYNGITIEEWAPGCHVSKSQVAGYLMRYIANTPQGRLDDPIYSYLVATPQECVEVISFEDPRLEYLG